MSNIGNSNWNETADSNTAAPPNGWPDGQEAATVNNCAREMMAATKRWFNLVDGTVTTTGSANAYVATFGTAPVLTENRTVKLKLSFSNTGACTLNVNSLGAVAIKKYTGSGVADPAAGDLQSGDVRTFNYVSSGPYWVIDSVALATTAYTNVDNAFSADQTIVSTDAGAAVGPDLTLYRNSASPADADVIGAVNFDGEDDGGAQTTYARVNAVIDDVTNTTEDGSLKFSTMIAGTLTEKLSIGAVCSWDLTSGELEFTSTDAGAGIGPEIKLYRNSASPADNDELGQISFYGEDDAGNKTLYGSVSGQIYDSGSGSEDGSVSVYTVSGGSENYHNATFNYGGIKLGGEAAVAYGSQGDIVSCSENTGSSSGPFLSLWRQSASPADNDYLGEIDFYGQDDLGNRTLYAGLGGFIVDTTDPTEDGEIWIGTMVSGTFADRWYIRNGLYSSNATGGDKGLGTINADAVYDDNTLLTCYVLEAARTGDIDETKWDALASFGTVEERFEEEVEVPLTAEEIEKAAPDENGTKPATKIEKRKRKRKVKKNRQHQPAKEFKRDLLPTLDRKEFSRRWKETGVLPGMPGPETYEAEGNVPTGVLVQKLWQTIELLAVHVDQLDQENDRLAEAYRALEGRVIALETAAEVNDA